MSKTLKINLIIALFAVIMLLMGTSIVNATLIEDITWLTIDGNLVKGQNYNAKLIENAEGLTIKLSEEEEYNKLPDGLTLNPNGTITGTVSETQSKDYYAVRIRFIREETDENVTRTYYFVILKGADFDNIFTDETTVNGVYTNDSSKEFYTNQGFLVYSPTLSDYISYNESTKTYNVTLTQNILGGDIGNYIEIIFKESEYGKHLKFEVLQNEGFKTTTSPLIETVDYPYVKDEEKFYSAYIWVEIDEEYTGNNRNMKFKISNPTNPAQYRYIAFNIVDTNDIYVAFESNGGNTIPTISTKIGEKITLPTNPTREGYDFKGWYKDKEYTTPFNAEEDIVKSIVLYAKWTEKAAVVTVEEPLDDTPNTGVTTNITIEYVTAVTILAGACLIVLRKRK